MHDLQAVAKECVDQLEAIGIRCGTIFFELDKRAQRRWGSCRLLSDGSCRIGISPKLLEAPEEALKNTLYHELLHAATGVTGHTGRWKQMAAFVSRALNTDITRASTWEEKGLDEASDPTVRYRFACTGCGTQVIRFRACPFTRRYKRYRCGRCGGSFRLI